MQCMPKLNHKVNGFFAEFHCADILGRLWNLSAKLKAHFFEILTLLNIQAVIKKWGNSPALRLIASFMQLAHLILDQRVSIQALKGKLVIEPISPKEYSLDNLVSCITPENCHAEIDVGQPVGMEML